MGCALCNARGPGGALPGPSDHEPWCPAFMVGPIGLEGQTTITGALEELADTRTEDT